MADKKAVVIFGATGDLAQKMLYPSLYFLDAEGHLPVELVVGGFSHTELSAADFAALTRKAVIEQTGKAFAEDAWTRFSARLRYCKGNLDAAKDYEPLAKMLGADECIFYLATSPDYFGVIARNLKQVGLAHEGARIAVEKPIGHDLDSCRKIECELAEAFSDDRIYRVDHYLGKETVQNLIALRFANTLFEPLWNKNSIEHVQITIAETLGVERRWSYYDSYGALRDIVQNHLLQLVCLVAMEPPASLDPDAVRDEKVKVLRSLRRIGGGEVERQTVRGQYRKGFSGEATVPGYCEESGGSASDTETFVAIAAHIDNWRWAGVPFYLRTGKRMPMRNTEIVVQFRQVPHSIFPHHDLIANRLTIRLQPKEEISLQLMNKTPSLDRGGMRLKPLPLDLSLSDAFKHQRQRIAYERLFLAALEGNRILFVRRDEVEEAWKWVDAIIEGWKARDMKPAPYTAGTWGPSGAIALTERNEHSWCE
ncbi:MAG: glucose-6-phosphate dehydrogenase [Rhizomicrobium sp.]|jgi:glucose-6-phosphate 1-dehydrogenase